MIRRLWPETIRGQMMAIILGAVVLVAITGEVSEALLKHQRGGIMDAEDYALSVSTASRLLAAKPQAMRPAEIDGWHAAGVDVALVANRELRVDPASWRSWWLFRGDVDTLPGGFVAAWIEDEPVLMFRLDADQALLFSDVPRYFLNMETISYISAVVVLFAGFSALALRGIAAPARRMADALRRTDGFLASDQPVRAEGPRELRALAHALNDMRERIQRLLESRNTMLRSVSHDLRTPLTRLHLRIERIEDATLRALAQSDVAQMDAMIETTLDYLRDGSAPLALERCDLGSILSTICDDFADTGGRIAYCGPDHIVMEASVTGLTRAISNICDNGLKFAPSVRVDAELLGPDLLIHVIDDGPGIPEALREKVLQPYVKLDPSRAGKGFGLGLSIATEIVARHGGDLHLLDHRPTGLHVQIRLPRHPRTG